VREAFGEFRWPISTLKSEEVKVSGDWGTGKIDQLTFKKQPVVHPFGWRDAVARVPREAGNSA
jgi:hypothetical protein